MIFIYLGLAFVEWLALVVLLLPFGVLVLAEVAGVGGIWGRVGTPGKRMIWWHVVAGFLLVGSTLMVPISSACDLLSMGRCSLGDWFLVTSETTLWLWTLSIVYGPMYAVRLRQQDVRAAEFIGLGVSLLPATFWALGAFNSDIEPSVSSAIVVVGAATYLVGLTVRWVGAKVAILASSCVVMLLGLTAVSGPNNPFWIFAAFAMGYAVFRAEWKRRLNKTCPTVQESMQEASESKAPMTSERAAWIPGKRTSTFIVVNAACILALFLIWWIGFGTGASAPAAVFALVGLATAAAGALLTTLTPMAFGHARFDIDHAAAAFIVVFVAAVVMHMIAVPHVKEVGYLGIEAGWKPVLVSFAFLGALAISVATLTGKLREVRPFMIAIVLPAAFLLPSDSFFTFPSDDSFLTWTERLIETGIAVVLLSIMWYVFGPGRRRESEQTVAATNPSPPLVSSP